MLSALGGSEIAEFRAARCDVMWSQPRGSCSRSMQEGGAGESPPLVVPKAALPRTSLGVGDWWAGTLELEGQAEVWVPTFLAV